eukprot:gene12010-5410_t
MFISCVRSSKNYFNETLVLNQELDTNNIRKVGNHIYIINNQQLFIVNEFHLVATEVDLKSYFEQAYPISIGFIDHSNMIKFDFSHQIIIFDIDTKNRVSIIEIDSSLYYESNLIFKKDKFISYCPGIYCKFKIFEIKNPTKIILEGQTLCVPKNMNYFPFQNSNIVGNTYYIGEKEIVIDKNIWGISKSFKNFNDKFVYSISKIEKEIFFFDQNLQSNKVIKSKCRIKSMQHVEPFGNLMMIYSLYENEFYLLDIEKENWIPLKIEKKKENLKNIKIVDDSLIIFYSNSTEIHKMNRSDSLSLICSDLNFFFL